MAVKILRSRYYPLVDARCFRTEVESFHRVQHENIVQLVGYCEETGKIVVKHNGRNIVVERSNRALCFEYVQNGSLERYISGTALQHFYLLIFYKPESLGIQYTCFAFADECSGLDWRTRYKIIKGICVGLRHLHEGLPSPIFHLDLKPQHILLDENMTPKIEHLGISTLLDVYSTPGFGQSSMWVATT